MFEISSLKISQSSFFFFSKVPDFKDGLDNIDWEIKQKCYIDQKKMIRDILYEITHVWFQKICQFFPGLKLPVFNIWIKFFKLREFVWKTADFSKIATLKNSIMSLRLFKSHEYLFPLKISADGEKWHLRTQKKYLKTI